jgi:hypothetical protein
MKHAASLILRAVVTLSVGVASARAGDTDRDRRTFDLAPGSTVEISRIAGPVEIKTTHGPGPRSRSSARRPRTRISNAARS